MPAFTIKEGVYYNFDNRPAWFVLIRRASEQVRRVIPPILKNLATDLIALTVYRPLAKLSWLGEGYALTLSACRCTRIAIAVSTRCAPTRAIDLALNREKVYS
jgi:hypothetical protein